MPRKSSTSNLSLALLHWHSNRSEIRVWCSTRSRYLFEHQDTTIPFAISSVVQPKIQMVLSKYRIRRCCRAVFFLLVGFLTNVAHGRLSVDPDTKCKDTYAKDPSKETCLATNDHFGRPCEFCVDKHQHVACYNADEAKFAKLFGEKCEIRRQ